MEHFRQKIQGPKIRSRPCLWRLPLTDVHWLLCGYLFLLLFRHVRGPSSFIIGHKTVSPSTFRWSRRHLRLWIQQDSLYPSSIFTSLFCSPNSGEFFAFHSLGNPLPFRPSVKSLPFLPFPTSFNQQFIYLNALEKIIFVY